MPDRNGMSLPEDFATLAAALRALPAATPQPDPWPDLARALAARRRNARLRAWGLALAASAALLTLVALLPMHRHDAAIVGHSTPAPQAMATAATDKSTIELTALHQRSQALERWIAGATQAPVDARDLMAAVEVEDMIGLVDLQLEAARGNADALPLWRQRVALLEDLATIRTIRYAFASNQPSGNSREFR